MTNMYSLEVNIIELLTLRMPTNDLAPRPGDCSIYGANDICEDLGYSRANVGRVDWNIH